MVLICISVSAAILVEVFFLHDRGKAFAVWLNTGLLGSVASGTLSGYIVQNTIWQVQFWYNVGLELLVAILVVLFLEETRFVRDGTQPAPLTFRQRLAGFFFLKRTVPKSTVRDYLHYAALPFKAAYSPTSFLIGLSLMMSITWASGVSTSLALFLQTPVEQGGYGFSPGQNAAMTFTAWVAVVLAQIYGLLVNDRVPLFICKRRGGIWHPEFRLYPLLFPMLMASVAGLAIFGKSLQHHWGPVILGLAMVLINFADISTISPCVTYAVESIGTEAATEVTTLLSFCRIILGVMMPLFIFDWIDAVGVEWVFGTMAFINAAAYGVVVICMVFGKRLRSLNKVTTQTEDEIKVMPSVAVAVA